MDDATGAQIFLAAAPTLGGFVLGLMVMFMGLRALVHYVRMAESAG